MRITKGMLQDALDAAAEFNQRRLVYVTPRQEIAQRDRPGFVSAACYGRGILLLAGEIGTNGNERYIQKVGL